MGNRDVLCDAGAQTSMYVTVSYGHGLQRWVCGYTIIRTEEDGEQTTLSNVTTEFGPFDSSTEVGYWVAALQRQVRSLNRNGDKR